ncbi:hypothetical protein AB0454_22580 [Streptomyces sp. NPDC093509]|uniref:hypothetical protein n=1 Tax=Streptomyces sp. NPDC093509 TaxID=3154982 RepID=UPI00344C16D1
MTTHQRHSDAPFYGRLTEISKLRDGWLDGDGKKPTTAALTQASILGPALPRDTTLHVYPTEAGGVCLEWKDEHGGHEIDVLPDGRLFLMTVERIAEDEMASLRAEVAAARKFAGEMRDFCSPHGVAADYADRLIESMDRAKGQS